MKKANLWNNLYLLVAVFFIAFILAFPTVPVKFSLWKWNVDTVIAGPNIDLTLLGKNFKKQLDTKLGLELGGGYKVTLKADLTNIDEANKEKVLSEIKSKLIDRSYRLGLEDFKVTSEKLGEDYNIYFEIGMYENFQNVMLVMSTGKIEFKQLKAELKTTDYANISSDPASYEDTVLKASDLDKVNYIVNPNTGDPAIQLVFSTEGLNKFAEVAKANVGYPVAIMLDGSIISAPTISESFVAGEITNPVISGGFDEAYSKSLATLLNSGELSASIDISNSELVDPLISRTLQTKVFYGSIIGFVVLSLLSIIIYRKFGILFAKSFAFNLVLIVALAKFGFPTVLSWIFGAELGDLVFQPVTVTLPVLIGISVSMVVFMVFHFRLFGKLRILAKENKSSEDSRVDAMKENLKFVVKVTIFISVIAIVIGWFGIGSFVNFGLGLGLSSVVSLFTYWALSQTLVALFHKMDKK